MKNEDAVLKSLNILYAEDDATMRINTTKTLALFCNRIFQAENGAEALELFKSEGVNIVILDYVMPLIDGYNVAKEIRKVDKQIPIFITSSYTEKEKLLSMIGLNITGYLEKPIDFNELMQTLKKCVNILIDNERLREQLGEGVEYDYVNKQIIVEGKIHDLSKHEYKFIEMLLRHKLSVVHTQNIVDTIYFGDVESNTLRNMVYRLRKKINKEMIVTIKEIGYMINIK
jgi:DNA-binding response OmpR family regulator